MNNQTLKSGQQRAVLTKLSSTESSYVSSKESSSGAESTPKKKNNNRKNRRRSQTPLRNNNNNKHNYTKNKQRQRSNSTKWRDFRRGSRSASRGSQNYSFTSNKQQTSKKKAWKNKICKFWKKGNCRYGDQCEWQHYDYTQIDYCEIIKRKKYNQTSSNGLYLVQTTTVQYMDENQIMSLIGKPTQLQQSISIAIKNKKQSKQMKKEIQKEIRKGNPNNEEKIEIKKKVIKKYINLMQRDVANEISMKRIQKKEEQKNIRAKKKQQQEDRMEAEIEENQLPNSKQASKNKPYKQQQDQQIVANNNQLQQQSYQNTPQSQISTHQQQYQFGEEKSESYESNLYIDDIEVKEQQQNQKEQSQSLQQQKQQQTKITCGTQGAIKTQQTLKFKADTDLLQGTGELTLRMDDSELIQYYQYDQIEQISLTKLVQRVHAEDWLKQTIEAINAIERQYKDTDSNEWDTKALIVIWINHQIFNKEVTCKNISKNPQESPTYKIKQAIISALLKFLEMKSDFRGLVTSERAQKFILNRIKDNKSIVQNTTWVTGMNKKAKVQIANGDLNPLCVVIQYK